MSGKKKLPLDQSVETTNEPTIHVTKTRFDMEQEMLECWRVTDDIRLFAEQGGDINTLASYYEVKFQRLWDTFETMINERTIR